MKDKRLHLTIIMEMKKSLRLFENVRSVYSTHTPQVQNDAAKHRQSTRQNICESPRVISVKHSSLLPDNGSLIATIS